MRDLLIAAGVPAAKITPEGRSTTTLENIAFALPILRDLGTRDVLIVTDWYHAPRARLAARRLGLTARSHSPGLKGARLKTQVKQGLREVPALVIYWVKAGR